MSTDSYGYCECEDKRAAGGTRFYAAICCRSPRDRQVELQQVRERAFERERRYAGRARKTLRRDFGLSPRA